MKHWVVLWRELGIRPCDVGDLTLDDALVAEVYAEDAQRRDTVAANRRGRRN